MKRSKRCYARDDSSVPCALQLTLSNDLMTRVLIIHPDPRLQRSRHHKRGFCGESVAFYSETSSRSEEIYNTGSCFWVGNFCAFFSAPVGVGGGGGWMKEKVWEQFTFPEDRCLLHRWLSNKC